MIKTIRVMLLPNNKQKTRLFQYANTARFAYNWALLNNVSHNVTKQAIKDACEAYRDFFKGYTKFPRFKSRKHSVPKFYQDNVKIQFTETHVKVEGFATSKKKNKQKLNWIRLAEHGRIPTENVKYMNPRFKYDGLNWWITVGIEYEDSTVFPSNEGIGIDELPPHTRDFSRELDGFTCTIKVRMV